MPAPSLARQLFDEITQADNPVAEIRRMVAEKRFEQDYLDFKMENPRGNKDEDRNLGKLKDIWSEVISGFANCAGGVVIFGVNAREHEHEGVKLDAAMEDAPLDNVRQKHAYLMAQRGVVDPPLAGLELHWYPTPEDPDRGYIVGFVPQGEYPPYRTTDKKQQFFMRAADKTPVANRAQLERLFFPRANVHFVANVVVSYSLRCHISPLKSRELFTILLEISVTNNGNATAHNTHVAMPRAKEVWEEIRPGSGWEAYFTERDQCFISTAPIHPGMRSRTIVGMEARQDKPPYALRFPITINCDNNQPQEIFMDIPIPQSLNWDLAPQKFEQSFSQKVGS